MKKKTNSKILWVLSAVLLVAFLVVDIIHFFKFRLHPVYPTFTEAYYESSIVSIFKWILGLNAFVGLILDRKENASSFYFISSSSIGILLLFAIKGQLLHLIRGSLVFSAGLLEVVAILMFVYAAFVLVKKYDIGVLKATLYMILTGVLLGILIYQLPVYNMPDGISLP